MSCNSFAKTPFFANARAACWRPGGLALTARALTLSALPQGARLLDVGCGLGGTTHFLRQQGFRVWGIDKKYAGRSSLNEGHAKKTHAATSPPDVCATARHLPFCAESFDGILCECVFSLLADIPVVLKEYARVCCFAPHKKQQEHSATLIITDVYMRENSACAQTLFTPQMLHNYLHATGWHVRCFEDHSYALKAFAAQLLWNLSECLPAFSTQNYGYGLWIAQKV